MILASFGTIVVSIGMVSTSVLLIGLILLQKNRGSGLSGAFGGVGGHTAFGTKTGDFLTWVTVGLVTLFMLLAIVGNFVFEPGKAVTAAQPPASPAMPVGQTPMGPEGGGPAAPITLPPSGGPQQIPLGKPVPVKVPRPTSKPS